MSIINIVADFHEDWIEFIKTQLTSVGIVIDKNKSDHSISLMYFNLLKRIIEQKPRRLEVSKGFSYPEKCKVALDIIKNKILAGDSLTSYLSRSTFKINQSKRYDGLLNAWGIHHLHLGIKYQGDFIEGTKELLFARFDDEVAYLIAIKNHHSWCDQELIQIIHNNWPQVISRYKLNNIANVSPTYSVDKQNIFRRKNVNIPLKMMDGTMYMSPGGGTASSGICIESVVQSDLHTDVIYKFERTIRQNIGKILERLTLSITDSDLFFNLVIVNGQPTAINRKYNISVKLHPNGGGITATCGI